MTSTTVGDDQQTTTPDKDIQSTSMLEVRNLSKYYNNITAVENLSFSIKRGELVTLLGPSGCGKSTTLHSIAGLVNPSEGLIFLRGENITNYSPSDRNIGMVFQNTALFPHMTAAENIAYGLNMHGYDEDQVNDRVIELLELVQMPEHDSHYPNELSGGQQQRIALARAVAYEPDILLLDEPLTGLDRVLREEMRHEIRRIQEEVGVTTLYVTHDQEEALSMSNKVVVLKDGIKQQEGSPKEIYQHPANEFIAEFVGKSTQFTGDIVETSPLVIDTGTLTIHAGSNADLELGQSVSVYIRPSDVSVTTTKQEGENVFSGVVINVTTLGSHAETFIELADGTKIVAEIDRFPDLQPGDEIFVTFPASAVITL